MRKIFLAISIVAILSLLFYFLNRKPLSDIAEKFASESFTDRIQAYRAAMALDQPGRNTLLQELEVDPSFKSQIKFFFQMNRPGSTLYKHS